MLEIFNKNYDGHHRYHFSKTPLLLLIILFFLLTPTDCQLSLRHHNEHNHQYSRNSHVSQIHSQKYSHHMDIFQSIREGVNSLTSNSQSQTNPQSKPSSQNHKPTSTEQQDASTTDSETQKPSQDSKSTQQQSQPGTLEQDDDGIISPKVTIALVVTLLVLVLMFFCCFFCIRCLLRQKKKSQQNVPFYNTKVASVCKYMNFILLADCILRWLGLRDDKQTRQAKKQKAKQEKLRLKEQKKQQKQQSRMVRQENVDDYAQDNPQGQWKTLKESPQVDQSEGERVKKEKCNLCMGKVKGKSNCVAMCNKKCAFHMQCLVDYQNENPKDKKKCPNCKSNFFNSLRFYCQKCWKKYTEVLLEQGNVYSSVLSYKDTLNSIGGEKCDECRKKWF